MHSNNTTTILTNIKDAEHKAEQIIQNALKAKAVALDEAKKRSLEIISQAAETIEKENEEQLATVEKQLEKRKDSILEKGALEAKELEKAARKNIEKAADFLLDEFQKRIK